MGCNIVQWLRSRGGYVNPKIDLFHQQESGDRSVFTRQDVNEGEQLLLIPMDTTLHLEVSDVADKGRRVPASCNPTVAHFLQTLDPPFSPFLATTVMLMTELAVGQSSGFQPYLQTLPEGTNCLLNWTDKELQLLVGTSLEVKGRSIQSIFKSDIAPVLQSAPEGLFPAAACTFPAFRHAADMVQTRAFHMQVNNWITGTSQESTDELYLIPAIDMLNHSTDPALRNTSLALIHSVMEVTLDDGQKRTFKDAFSMKAERNIPAGIQVLHTYGDLADAQLLQTYGFIETLAPCQSAAAAAGGAADNSSGASKGKCRRTDGAASSATATALVAGGNSVNPHNYALVYLHEVLQSVKTVGKAARLWPAKKAQKLLDARVAFLTARGMLQQEGPNSSKFITTAAAALPNNLLTVLQVLLMPDDDFEQLQQETQQHFVQQQQDDAGASSGNGAASSSRPAAELSLGRELLQGEFGELCATVLVHLVGLCLKRYPTFAAAPAAKEKHKDSKAAPGADARAISSMRHELAAAVVAGEQQLLQQMKKEALVIMLQAAQEDDEVEDSDDDEEEEDENRRSEAAGLEQEGSEEQPGSHGEEDQQPRQGQANRHSCRQPRQQQRASRKLHQHEYREHSRRHNQGNKADHEHQGIRNTRPHYGDMTGPSEEAIWMSDDSDKVGYSSDPDDSAVTPAATAAAAGGRSKKQQPRQRHPMGPSEPHTYEVGAAGAVREAHGHMLGPEEANLIDSDDSDKVGYVDDGPGDKGKRSPAAAASKADGSKGGGSDEQPARKKRSKAGLDFKG